jgi:hypothetical protein
MSTPEVSVRARARWVWASLGVTVAGVSIGWFMRPLDARTFEHIYPIGSSIGFATLCVSLLIRRTELARWGVPLLLGVFMASVGVKPHVLALSAVGVAAGVIATFAALFDRKSVAIVGTLLCCPAIGASLFMGQRTAEQRSGSGAMDDRGTQRGLASLCIGGDEAVAVVVERC